MPWCAAAHQAGFSQGTPWLQVDPSHRAAAVNLQQDDPASMLHFTRSLLALRRRHEALRLGSFEPLHVDGQILVLLRRHGGSAVLAAFNFGPEARAQALAQPLVAAGPSLAVGAACLKAQYLVLPAGSALIVPVHV